MRFPILHLVNLPQMEYRVSMALEVKAADLKKIKTDIPHCVESVSAPIMDISDDLSAAIHYFILILIFLILS